MKRNTLFILIQFAGLVLTGCGFTPVYGPSGVAEGLHGAIAVDPPRDAEGFVYVRQLESRFGGEKKDFTIVGNAVEDFPEGFVRTKIDDRL